MEIKKHFGVYGICFENGKLLCIEKTRGPYQHRFDLPGGSQEAGCLLYTSPSPRDVEESRMPSSA